MAHLLQVGAGSGGMPVLELVARDPRITRVTLIEPDIYKPHNVERHLFSAAGIGESKAELAREWLLERRPELRVDILIEDLLNPAVQERVEAAAASADVGVCAADNEPAKYHWDALMRRFGKPWTLGEVLSGGIGGFVHLFRPGMACYGCVASRLKRAIDVEPGKAPDYSQPNAAVEEARIPAGRASISVIASMHALLTLHMLDANFEPGFTTLLFSLEQVAGIFDQSFKPHRYRIPRSPDCLVCRESPQQSGAALDGLLEQALDRLG